jgi:hypothetical protein
LHLLYLGLLIALSGTVNGQTQDTLYILRKGRIVGALLNFKIKINGQPVCRLSNRRYIAVPVGDGPVTIETYPTGLAIKRPVRMLTLETVNGPRYVMGTTKITGITMDQALNMRELSAEEGAEAVQKIGKLDLCQRR